jgi:DNA-binding response OmpR family regulator
VPDTVEEELTMLIHEDAHKELRQSVVLALTDSMFAARAIRHFRWLGWEVHLTQSGDAVHPLARAFAPAVVVLQTELPDESGWLVCEKLNREAVVPKVILVGHRRSADQERFASFVGAAALVTQKEGIAALATEVLEATLSAAG